MSRTSAFQRAAKLVGDLPPAGFLTTYTGVRFYFAAPGPDMVSIRDVAHSLSLIPHWNGHSRLGFSVAQHSLLVEQLSPPHLSRHALLHDAAEAYYGDMVRPLKVLLPEYRRLYQMGERAVYRRFGVGWPEPPELKYYDNMALALEARALMAPGALHDGYGNPLDLGDLPDVDVTPMEPEEAETAFLVRFSELFPNDQEV